MVPTNDELVLFFLPFMEVCYLWGTYIGIDLGFFENSGYILPFSIHHPPIVEILSLLFLGNIIHFSLPDVVHSDF
jgi:hypothetical protein